MDSIATPSTSIQANTPLRYKAHRAVIMKSQSMLFLSNGNERTRDSKGYLRPTELHIQ